MSEKKVVEMWWSGDDFFVETEDGEVAQYKDAYITNIGRSIESTGGTTIVRDETVTYSRPR